MECHPGQYAHWAGTRHAASFQPVTALGCDHHPRCFKCHSTGFSCRNGFSLPPPPQEFGSINCEVCHGSLGGHVSNFLVLPRSIRGGEEGAEAKLCSFCHDAKHSPEFDYEYHRSQVACPIIDYSAEPMRTMLEEKAAEMQRAKLDLLARLDRGHRTRGHGNDEVDAAIANIGREVTYPPIAIDGAEKAARLISDLLNAR